MRVRDETADELRTLLDEAQNAVDSLPSYPRILQLDEQLRALLGQLLLEVQEHTDTLWRGDIQWDHQQRVIDHARTALEDGLGDGLRSAALHVHTLARHCQLLHTLAVEAAE